MPTKLPAKLLVRSLLNPEKHPRLVELAEEHRDVVLGVINRESRTLRGILSCILFWPLFWLLLQGMMMLPLEPWVSAESMAAAWLTTTLTVAFYWGVPIGVALLAAVLANNAVLVRRVSRLASVNFCLQCLYPLERVDGVTCPECGAVQDLEAGRTEDSDG